MAHSTQSNYPDSGGSACPAPMTRAALLSLRASSSLSKDCNYVITDFVQNRLVAGTTITLHAVSSNELSESVHVNTTYDNEAWRGLYNIDTNILFELSDNQGNTVSDSLGTNVGAFDWGNINYRDCKIGRCTFSVSYGATNSVQNIKIDGLSTLNLTNYLQGSLLNITIDGQSSLNLSGARISISNAKISNQSAVTFTNYTANNSISRLNISSSQINCSGSAAAFAPNTLMMQNNGLISHQNIAVGNFSSTDLEVSNNAQIVHSAASTITLNRFVASNSSTVQLFGLGSFVASNTTIRNGSTINMQSLSNSTTSISNSNIVNGSSFLVTAASTGGSATMTTSTLMDGGRYQKSNIGTLSVSSSTISNVGLVILSGTSNLAITRSFVSSLSTVRNIANGAGINNSIFDYVISARASFTVSGTITGNNTFNTGNISGISGQISIANSSLITMNNISVNDGRITISNQNTPMTNINYLNASVLGFINITGNTVNKAISNVTCMGGTANIQNCTSVGNISDINVLGSGVYTITGTATTSTSITCLNGGRFTQNGGSSSYVRKSMLSTLTSGNFNHSRIIHETQTSKTLTTNNTNRADYMGLVSQLT